jgi:hypothetical protein
MSFLDRFQNLSFPVKIKVRSTAGATYHGLATTGEPWAQQLYQDIKSQLDYHNLEVAEDLATITVQINVRRKSKI